MAQINLQMFILLFVSFRMKSLRFKFSTLSCECGGGVDRS